MHITTKQLKETYFLSNQMKEPYFNKFTNKKLNQKRNNKREIK